MIQYNFTDRQLDFDIQNYSLEKETRGWIYVLEDSAFPGYIKIGRTTDLERRIKAYNDSRPYPSVSVTVVSKQFKDVLVAERLLLESLYRRFNVAPKKLEWFGEEALENILELLESIEQSYD